MTTMEVIIKIIIEKNSDISKETRFLVSTKIEKEMISARSKVLSETNKEYVSDKILNYNEYIKSEFYRKNIYCENI